MGNTTPSSWSKQTQSKTSLHISNSPRYFFITLIERNKLWHSIVSLPRGKASNPSSILGRTSADGTPQTRQMGTPLPLLRQEARGKTLYFCRDTWTISFPKLKKLPRFTVSQLSTPITGEQDTELIEIHRNWITKEKQNEKFFSQLPVQEDGWCSPKRCLRSDSGLHQKLWSR